MNTTHLKFLFMTAALLVTSVPGIAQTENEKDEKPIVKRKTYDHIKDKDIEFAVEESIGPKLYFPDPIGEKKRKQKQLEADKKFNQKLAKKMQKIWAQAQLSWNEKHPVIIPDPEAGILPDSKLALFNGVLPGNGSAGSSLLSQNGSSPVANQLTVADTRLLSDQERQVKMKQLFSKLNLKKFNAKKVLARVKSRLNWSSKKEQVVATQIRSQVSRAPASILPKQKAPSLWNKYKNKLLNSWNKLFK